MSAQREATVCVSGSSSNLVSDGEDCGKQGDRGKGGGYVCVYSVYVCVTERERGKEIK